MAHQKERETENETTLTAKQPNPCSGRSIESVDLCVLCLDSLPHPENITNSQSTLAAAALIGSKSDTKTAEPTRIRIRHLPSYESIDCGANTLE
jgi:hypothetical protein